MQKLSEDTFKYKGFSVHLEEFDKGSGGSEWYWNVEKADTKSGDNSKTGGCSR
jgi:hypothetical protein